MLGGLFHGHSPASYSVLMTAVVTIAVALTVRLPELVGLAVDTTTWGGKEGPQYYIVCTPPTDTVLDQLTQERSLQ